MPNKRIKAKKRKNPLAPKTPSGRDTLYKTGPADIQPTSDMGVRMDDTWVSKLQVSGKYPEIGYQIVDEIVKEHQQ